MAFGGGGGPSTAREGGGGGGGGYVVGGAGGGGGYATAAVVAEGGGGDGRGGGGGGTARVTFRVRAESLGHGEGAYLCPDDARSRPIPLYTTASTHPWYTARVPVSLALPSPPPSSSSSSSSPYSRSAKVVVSASVSEDEKDEGEVAGGAYTYRYAVFRAGEFHRWENSKDAPGGGEGGTGEEEDATMSEAAWTPSTATPPPSSSAAARRHRLPLRLLSPSELYTVNDVMGLTAGRPDVEHHPTVATGADSLADLNDLHRSGGETDSRSSFTALRRTNSSKAKLKDGGGGSVGGAGGTASGAAKDGKKRVGFAAGASSAPPASSRRNGTPATGPSVVRLDSTDGLVVASAFLPVILHRSDADGSWTARWDYEALLSMQTHLRVTRVGVVKWRGWHGNRGRDGSPEGGVPEEERGAVEECLRPFSCVPVWAEPALFGEMYNGFCKGVLWPILHNVTSVYSSRPETTSVPTAARDSDGTPVDGGGVAVGGVGIGRDGGFGGDGHVALDDPNAQFSEYDMDDVTQGPIHGDGGREADLWKAYTEVNRKFADAIVQCFNEGDLVWIHGFHLLILPSFVTRRLPMAKVGIFLHTPFPSSEIFRTVWCREDLLRGMLNADQVGFHLFEYARHFLTCCRRLLGLNYGMIPDGSGGHNLAIESNGRHVTVTSIHAGIEPPVLDQILEHHSTLERAFHIRAQYGGGGRRTIFCAIDRMESLKGIPLKMLGLERFLNRKPEYAGRIVLVQVGISAPERGDDYLRTRKEVMSMVENINRSWPGTVQFRECAESEMRLQQRVALMRAADALMVTPIRDGLNLLPLEFTVVHRDALTAPGKDDGRRRGLCILSEFSSCTRVMRGALHVNPWKISEIAGAFHQALTMSEDERMRRLSTASEFVGRVTTQRWALAVMLDLKGVHKNADVGGYSGAGLGLGYRLVGMNAGFVPLDSGRVAKAYKRSHSRLILVDYGGTIVANDNTDNLSRFQMVTKTRAPSVPSGPTINALRDMCADKRNVVFVVSGKERHSLVRALGHVPNLGLAAEHGMFISWPNGMGGVPGGGGVGTSDSFPPPPSSPSHSPRGQRGGGGGGTKKKKRRWETVVPDQDRSWRSIAIAIMEVYASRTHGSYIEETEMKVLWQYRDADPEFGYLQSRELEDHLSNVLRGFAVDILHGGVQEGGYVEVRPRGVNKGVLAMHVLRNLRGRMTANKAGKPKVDFVLVLGDDHCDEPMLSTVRQVGRRAKEAQLSRGGGGGTTTAPQSLPPLPSTITLVDVSSCDPHVSSSALEVFTCTVGKKPSAAANYLNDVEEVTEMLETLVKVATRDQRFYSSVDLRSIGSPSNPVAAIGGGMMGGGGGGGGGFMGNFGGGLLVPPGGMGMAVMGNSNPQGLMAPGGGGGKGASALGGGGNNAGMMGMGMMKSTSMGQFHSEKKTMGGGGGGGGGFGGGGLFAPAAPEPLRVSANLNEYLGAIEDDGDEDEEDGILMF